MGNEEIKSEDVGIFYKTNHGQVVEKMIKEGMLEGPVLDNLTIHRSSFRSKDRALLACNKAARDAAARVDANFIFCKTQTYGHFSGERNYAFYRIVSD